MPDAAQDSAAHEDEVVTVVVPARNEERSITACLESIRSQDWQRLEILVVDGDSSDRTCEIVEKIAADDPRVRLLHNARRLIPVSLNVALREAGSRWLVRVDAHAAVPPGYVRRAVEHLRTERYGGVGGRKDGVGVTPAGRAIARAMSSRFGVGGSTYHWGDRVQTVEHIPFGAYPVHLLRELGGWDETLAVNQDFELDFRLRAAGHPLLFDPALRIDWECRQSIPELWRQYRRYGGGKVTVARKHPGSLRPRHLAAPALVAVLAGAGAVAPWRPRVAALACAPYLAALTAASVTTARDLDAEARPYVAPAFAAMHVAWGIGFWQRAGAILLGRHR